MKKIKIVSIVGARPNFVKIAPLLKEFKKNRRINSVLVHTSQHYDWLMSDIFFRQLKIPVPDIYLGVSHMDSIERMAMIVRRLIKVLDNIKPDLMIVVGDVDSTFAAAFAAREKKIKLVHIEAGLRSFNLAMSEEVNRIFTDKVSDLLFAPSKDAVANLVTEKIPMDKIFLVGNIMIDTLKDSLKLIRQNAKILKKLSLEKKKYALLTLHRRENIEKKEKWQSLIRAFQSLSRHTQIVYPLHPHSRKLLIKFHLWKKIKKIPRFVITPPLAYIDFLSLLFNAGFVMTDSGGIQEESSFIDVPCLTLREETERPITVERGTNVLVGCDRNKIIEAASRILGGKQKVKKVFPLWDGKTSERITKIILNKF